MRANLFANATAATLWWVRMVSCASHVPSPEDCLVRCCKYSTCALHEQSSQVGVPPFADTEQLLLAACRVFARNQAYPRGELPLLVEGRSVANRCDDGGCPDGSHTRDSRPGAARLVLPNSPLYYLVRLLDPHSQP